jgi:putative hydrolase of the HAD superfamily
VRTLLVDLDDTLLDYSGGVDECWSAACQAVAAPAGIDSARLVESVRLARRWFWDDPERHRRERVDMLGAWSKIVEEGFERLGTPNRSLAAAIAEDFAARRWEVMRLFPGTVETLGRLRERGVTMALVTNGDKSQQRRKIERYELARYFDIILIEGEFGTGKPDEAVYRHVLERLRVPASEAWMVGDHLEWDVVAPQRLGLRGIWVDRGGAGLAQDSPVRPHRIIRDFSEILEP